jgi:hypothetical protein
MGSLSSMRSFGCLSCLIIFTSAQSFAREHSISKHETWFWEPFNPDLCESDRIFLFSKGKNQSVNLFPRLTLHRFSLNFSPVILAAGPTTFEPHDDHIISKNVYFHTDRFYSLIEATNTTTTDDAIILSKNFAHNSAINPLPLTKVPSFLSNIKSGWVSGTTLLIPFPEVDSPHHMGYWMEVLAPVYSYLNNDTVSSSTSANIRAVLIPNLSRGTVMSSSWVMEMIKIATEPAVNGGKTEKEEDNENGKTAAAAATGRPPMRILFWDDLEHTPLDSWLGFERILHVYTRYSNVHHQGISQGGTTKEKSGQGGNTSGGDAAPHQRDTKFSFSSPEIAKSFRLAVHTATGIPPPAPDAHVPLTITYLMPTDSSGVTNNKHVLDTLQQAAAAAAPGAATAPAGGSSNNDKIRIAVRPYSPTPSVPLASLVAVMSRTGLLIGRHGPLLANAVFLPPGSAVVEILPYNWNSGGLSEIYKNLTASRSIENKNSTGKESIVHVAWRAPSGNWMRYESEEDSRYVSWTPVECSSEHCIDAHARAGVEVNIEEFREIIDDVLEVLITNNHGGGFGKEFSSLKKKIEERYPWPRRVELTGTSGLWWDT